jgi:selenide,water dikinase
MRGASSGRGALSLSGTYREPVTTYRLTQYASGGGCACKIPPGELEEVVRGLTGHGSPDLLVGLDDGDDAAVVRVDERTAVVATADFFTPVVDDAYDWGRIAAANALSDVYAMGGRPVVAVNLVGWPRATLPTELLTEVLRGGLDVAREAACPVAGGHSIDDPEPKYGMAVTGLVDPARLLRNDAAVAGQPLTLTKPLGVGLLNNRHKATGEVFAHAVDSMARLNRDASVAAVAAGARAATDVTGFGLLGHLHKMMRASGTTAVVDAAAVPCLDGAREALRDGYVSGGTRRNLDWVRPSLSASVDEDELLLLADAQTSGGLLVVGEVPGYPVVGEVVVRRDVTVHVR